MTSNTPDPIPFDLLPALAQASTDLIQLGTLSNLAEAFALDRASSKASARFPSEVAIEERLNSGRDQIRTAIQAGRDAAERFPLAFNESVSNSLSNSKLAIDDRASFDEALDTVDGDYASAAITLCDRIGRALDSAGSSGS